MKQSGRSFLPKVHELRTLGDLLGEARQYDRKLIAHEQPDPAALHAGTISNAKSVIILIGPEGGFTPQEKAAAEKAGFHHWYLGARRLRTETAAIVTAAMSLLADADSLLE